MRLASLALLIGVLGLSGCGLGNDEACTAIGCNSEVSIGLGQLQKELPRAQTIEVCVAGECTHHPLKEGGKPEGKYVPRAYTDVSGIVSGLHHGLGPYPVSVTVYDRQGAVLLRATDTVVMKKSTPNGAGCPPTCFFAGLNLNVGRHRLEPPVTA